MHLTAKDALSHSVKKDLSVDTKLQVTLVPPFLPQTPRLLHLARRGTFLDMCIGLHVMSVAVVKISHFISLKLCACDVSFVRHLVHLPVLSLH